MPHSSTESKLAETAQFFLDHGIGYLELDEILKSTRKSFYTHRENKLKRDNIDSLEKLKIEFEKNLKTQGSASPDQSNSRLILTNVLNRYDVSDEVLGQLKNIAADKDLFIAKPEKDNRDSYVDKGEQSRRSDYLISRRSPDESNKSARLSDDFSPNFNDPLYRKLTNYLQKLGITPAQAKEILDAAKQRKSNQSKHKHPLTTNLYNWEDLENQVMQLEQKVIDLGVVCSESTLIAVLLSPPHHPSVEFNRAFKTYASSQKRRTDAPVTTVEAEEEQIQTDKALIKSDQILEEMDNLEKALLQQAIDQKSNSPARQHSEEIHPDLELPSEVKVFLRQHPYSTLALAAIAGTTIVIVPLAIGTGFSYSKDLAASGIHISGTVIGPNGQQVSVNVPFHLSATTIVLFVVLGIGVGGILGATIFAAFKLRSRNNKLIAIKPTKRHSQDNDEGLNNSSDVIVRNLNFRGLNDDLILPNDDLSLKERQLLRTSIHSLTESLIKGQFPGIEKPVEFDNIQLVMNYDDENENENENITVSQNKGPNINFTNYDDDDDVIITGKKDNSNEGLVNTNTLSSRNTNASKNDPSPAELFGNTSVNVHTGVPTSPVKSKFFSTLQANLSKEKEHRSKRSRKSSDNS